MTGSLRTRYYCSGATVCSLRPFLPDYMTAKILLRQSQLDIARITLFSRFWPFHRPYGIFGWPGRFLTAFRFAVRCLRIAILSVHVQPLRQKPTSIEGRYPVGQDGCTGRSDWDCDKKLRERSDWDWGWSDRFLSDRSDRESRFFGLREEPRAIIMEVIYE